MKDNEFGFIWRFQKNFYAGFVSSDEYYGIIKVNVVQLYGRQDANFYNRDIALLILLTGTSESTGVKIFYDNSVQDKPCSKNQPMKK